jgi:hypothetical protein
MIPAWYGIVNKMAIKSEARNPKLETISNDQNSNVPNKIV